MATVRRPAVVLLLGAALAPTAVASPTGATGGQFQIAYFNHDQRDIWAVPADGIASRT